MNIYVFMFIVVRVSLWFRSFLVKKYRVLFLELCSYPVKIKQRQFGNLLNFKCHI